MGRGVRALVGALVLILAPACAGGDSDPSAAPSSPAGGSVTESTEPQPEPQPEPTTPPADPEHAVEAPGPRKPRTQPLLPADMLIFNEERLSPRMVERIKAIQGIVAVEQIGLGQVVIENRAINVAAVDPGSYRRFTPAGTADLLEAWVRVAGGELAIAPAVGRRLQDDAGNVTLGSSADSATIHIGAFAPQVEQVDAVVNRKWGEELGMEFGNAVLISTGPRTPVSVRKPIQRIVGDDASVQRLDVAARLGLDTSVQQTAYLTGGSIAELVGTFNYTVLSRGRIAPEPSWVASNIATGTVPILGRVTCHREIFPQLEAALLEIQARGLADEIHPEEYAGCYYPRFIAGTTKLSNHSFGLALDLNVPGNQRGTVGEMDRTVVSIFEKWGFAWGGHWRYTDPMHFELSSLVEVR